MKKIYSAVEQAILDSIARGEPDKLSNKGQPLDLTEWLRTPEHLRMSHSILKNAGIKPAEIEIKQQISDLKAAIQALDKEKDKLERTTLVNQLNKLMVTHQLRMERLNRR
jgi:predicted N-acyltransferase